MNQDNYLICNYGKKRGSINSKNWERHLDACQKNKHISSMSSIKNVFKSTTSLHKNEGTYIIFIKSL